MAAACWRSGLACVREKKKGKERKKNRKKIRKKEKEQEQKREKEINEVRLKEPRVNPGPVVRISARARAA